MSYLHCPRCQHAYNAATQPACPSCGPVVPAVPADPVDDVVAATEQLARALARATPDEIAAAQMQLDDRTPRLAAGGTAHREDDGRPLASAILDAVRARLAPPMLGPQQALLATVALALLSRLAPPRRTLAARAAAWSSRARALLARF